MKKILMIALLFVSMILLNSQNAVAMPGGLLDGLKLNKGSEIDNTFQTVTELTDNNISSISVLNTVGTINDTIWYKFSSPHTISSFYIKAGGDVVAPKTTRILTFFSSEKKVLYQQNFDPKSEIQSLPLDVTDVVYVSIENSSQSIGQTFSEFDVFETLPTATPVPTPTPSPEAPSSDRAILVITMSTGLEKEFDLPMAEVNSFLDWYDTTTGSARYGINKHDNNKGPFSKRTEYVIHDKILTFEVSEYTTK